MMDSAEHLTVVKTVEESHSWYFQELNSLKSHTNFR